MEFPDETTHKQKKDFEFLNIYPPALSITLSNSSKIFKNTIEIKNLMIFPLVIRIRSSDSRAIEINKTTIKINSKQTEKIQIILHYDFLNKKINVENLYIHFESDLLEYKYPIIIKFQNHNSTIKENSTNNFFDSKKNLSKNFPYKKIDENKKNLKEKSKSKLENVPVQIDKKYLTHRENTNSNNNNNNKNNQIYNSEIYELIPHKRNKSNENKINIDVKESKNLSLKDLICSEDLKNSNNSGDFKKSFSPKINDLETEKDYLITSNATFYPNCLSKNSMISSHNSRNGSLGKNKNYINHNLDNLNKYRNSLLSINQEYKNNHNTPFHYDYNNINKVFNSEFFESSNLKENKKFIENPINNKNQNQKNLNLNNQTEIKQNNFQKIDQNNTDMNIIGLKDNFIKFLFASYEKNKNNYNQISEIIDFILTFVKNLELKQNKNLQESKYLENNMKLYRSLSNKKTNFSKFRKNSNIKKNKNIQTISNNFNNHKNITNSNFSSNNSKERENLNSENKKITQEIVSLKFLLQNFLENFSKTIFQINNIDDNLEMKIREKLHNTQNIPKLSTEQIEFLFNEIQNLHFLSDELNTYKIQSESLFLNLDVMKKNMKTILYSVNDYKNIVLKSEIQSNKTEKKINQLLTIIKSKDKIINGLKNQLKSGNKFNELDEFKKDEDIPDENTITTKNLNNDNFNENISHFEENDKNINNSLNRKNFDKHTQQISENKTSSNENINKFNYKKNNFSEDQNKNSNFNNKIKIYDYSLDSENTENEKFENKTIKDDRQYDEEIENNRFRKDSKLTNNNSDYFFNTKNQSNIFDRNLSHYTNSVSNSKIENLNNENKEDTSNNYNIEENKLNIEKFVSNDNDEKYLKDYNYVYNLVPSVDYKNSYIQENNLTEYNNNNKKQNYFDYLNNSDNLNKKKIFSKEKNINKNTCSTPTSNIDEDFKSNSDNIKNSLNKTNFENYKNLNEFYTQTFNNEEKPENIYNSADNFYDLEKNNENNILLHDFKDFSRREKKDTKYSKKYINNLEQKLNSNKKVLFNLIKGFDCPTKNNEKIITKKLNESTDFQNYNLDNTKNNRINSEDYDNFQEHDYKLFHLNEKIEKIKNENDNKRKIKHDFDIFSNLSSFRSNNQI